MRPLISAFKLADTISTARIVSLFVVLSFTFSIALPATASAGTTGRSAKSAEHHPNRGSLSRLREARARASIIGGVAAETGTLPYLAYIIDETGEEDFEVCTGTVLSPNVILTAGHCGEDEETGVLDRPEDFAVVTGNVEWTAPAANKQVSDVSKIVIYPGYVRSLGLGDASLLILSTPTTAPAISLASFPSDAPIIEAGRAALIAGWGKTFYEQEELTERLRWANTVIQRPAYCEANAPTFYPSEELCVIDPPDDETGACNGDSGGPLLSANESDTGLIETGVISHGYGECSTTRPTVVTRADLLVSWANAWIAAVKPPPPPTLAPTPAPAPAPAPAPTPAPAPVQPAPVAPAVPPNLPGIYVTPRSKRGQKITAHVAGDGIHLVGLTAKITVNCQHGYTYEVDSSWLSYTDTVLITNHVATATLEAETSRYVKAGSIGLWLQFNGTNTLEGRLRVHIRTKHSRAGLCSGTIPFKATE